MSSEQKKKLSSLTHEQDVFLTMKAISSPAARYRLKEYVLRITILKHLYDPMLIFTQLWSKCVFQGCHPEERVKIWSSVLVNADGRGRYVSNLHLLIKCLRTEVGAVFSASPVYGPIPAGSSANPLESAAKMASMVLASDTRLLLVYKHE